MKHGRYAWDNLSIKLGKTHMRNIWHIWRNGETVFQSSSLSNLEELFQSVRLSPLAMSPNILPRQFYDFCSNVLVLPFGVLFLSYGCEGAQHEVRMSKLFWERNGGLSPSQVANTSSLQFLAFPHLNTLTSPQGVAAKVYCSDLALEDHENG